MSKVILRYQFRCILRRETYQHFDFSRFPKLDTKLLQNLEHVLTHDIPELMAKFSAEISSLSLFADSGIPSGMRLLVQY